MPKALEPGDTIGVVAPSGPPDPHLLEAGVGVLARMGFKVSIGKNVGRLNGYVAGTDRERSDDLNSMLNDPDIRAILFARGGYGSMRILESVDLNAVMSDPKPLLGMSDISALQLSLYAKCGLVTFSGPMVASQIGEGLDNLSEAFLIRSLTEPAHNRDLWPQAAASIRPLRSGRAAGPLLGGCLSLVTALMGTAHCPDFTGAALILEDIQEPAYRLDRMLTQLKLAGVLDSVGGIVLGHFVGPEGEDQADQVERIVMELLGGNRIPVVSRYPHGHVLPNLTIPHGATVTLDTATSELKVTV